MPVDDNFLLEDEFKTQLVDLVGETQFVDVTEETQPCYLARETQLMDLALETQVLDDFDCVNHAPTQLLHQSNETQVFDDIYYVNIPTEFFTATNIEVSDASDNDKTNKTVGRCDTQQLSPDDSLKGHGRDLATHLKTVDASSGKQGDCVCGTPSHYFTAEEHNSEILPQFVLRQLEPQVWPLLPEEPVVIPCSLRSEKSSLEQRRCEQEVTFHSGDFFNFGRKNNEECSWNENDESSKKLRGPIRKGSNIMRKLFTEDRVVEVCQSEADINQTDDNLNMPELNASENHLAGLSLCQL
ncbi:uncharacterized protein LOC142554955 isoform X2 [Primulina tabacum]